VIYAVTDYLKVSGELRPDYSARVRVNGRTLMERRFSAADAMAPQPVRIQVPAGDLSAGAPSIEITKNGMGRLYWAARGDYYSAEQKHVLTGSSQLNVLREYYRLTPAKEGERIVYDLNPLEGQVSPGDVLAVRLTVSGGDWRYLMIEDPIASGTEFILRDDLYEVRNRPSWWAWFYSRREFRDDRAAFFQTYFSAGQQQYLYLLKVVNPGVFRVSPARVQPMYQPEALATSNARVVEVR
jgi:alpha-2-macroglobulin